MIGLPDKPWGSTVVQQEQRFISQPNEQPSIKATAKKLSTSRPIYHNLKFMTVAAGLAHTQGRVSKPRLGRAVHCLAELNAREKKVPNCERTFVEVSCNISLSGETFSVPVFNGTELGSEELRL